MQHRPRVLAMLSVLLAFVALSQWCPGALAERAGAAAARFDPLRAMLDAEELPESIRKEVEEAEGRVEAGTALEQPAAAPAVGKAGQPAPAAAKPAAPRWVSAVRSRTRTCVMVLNEMLDHDRSCVGLRRELQHLREEGADKEQLDEKRAQFDQKVSALKTTRERLHTCAQELMKLLEPHPTFNGEWEGSMQDPVWEEGMRVVKAAVYDGTLLHTHDLGQVAAFADPFHDYPGLV